MEFGERWVSKLFDLQPCSQSITKENRRFMKVGVMDAHPKPSDSSIKLDIGTSPFEWFVCMWPINAKYDVNKFSFD